MIARTALILLALATANAAWGADSAPAAKPKFATDVPQSITTPDSIETRLGTLKFTDGFPDDATVEKLYDNQTRSQLQTDEPFPSLGSQKKGIVINEDKSADVYFGPKAPAGKESNWIQTIPGQGWNAILRLYGPLEPWFDKTWQPGEIEEVP